MGCSWGLKDGVEKLNLRELLEQIDIKSLNGIDKVHEQYAQYVAADLAGEKVKLIDYRL
ncbi:MAG: hypothetical protein QY330_04290 [Candidatus Dojkabacteria bacterium]|nr:MAG: hypothetical protein QY330_04290 [Candidatus Dojkabacteria bacterium]